MSPSLVMVLGDQLSPNLASLRHAENSSTVVVMAEVMGELTSVRHHKKKIAFVLSAMRHFAAELAADGWRVDYVALTDQGNTGSLVGEARRAMARHGAARITVVEPSEWRVKTDLASVAGVDMLPDDRFLVAPSDFALWFGDRRAPRMEHFYRLMRRKTGLLMTDDEPVGQRWNFDAENRKSAPPSLRAPRPLAVAPDAITEEVLVLVEQRFGDNFGALRPFDYAVTRADALRAAEQFMNHALPTFGDYQDVMMAGEPYLYHSRLSAYLNFGLLDPMELCRRAEQEFAEGRAPLNAVEGFIRQIIGWREFVRGVYWCAMPDYVRRNDLGAHRDLPDFYWTGDTAMACVKACVEQTRELAYAHHIQRLMITGLFALLAGIDPAQVHEWYLSVYIDALEWVELPNTLGMSQFADGGMIASKPYAASGAYIQRMSNYCDGCSYDVSAKSGTKACPFNYLYWDFIARHRDRLKGNVRMANPVRAYAALAETRKAEIRTDAARFLSALDGNAQSNI